MSELITQEMEIPEEHILDFTTTKIKGRLNYIMFFVDGQIQIKIVLQQFPDLIIYENNYVLDSMYLPLRIRPINKMGEGFNYSHIRMKFNDSLRFIIQGNKGTKFRAIIDWDKDVK